jgi:FkbM family methyltransferase
MAHQFGVELSPYRPLGVRRAKLLIDYGIDLVLDVGANTGQYASELRESGYTGPIVSFEPLTGPFRELAAQASHDPRWSCHKLALGRSPGTRTINVAHNFVSSSFLELDPEWEAMLPAARYVAREEVEVVPLDALDLNLGGRSVLLKLDVQGCELEVLRGASRSIDLVTLVEAELSIEAVYVDQPSILDMMRVMADLGFNLISLEPGFSDPVTGKLLEVDGTFARGPQAAAAVDRG